MEDDNKHVKRDRQVRNGMLLLVTVVVFVLVVLGMYQKIHVERQYRKHITRGKLLRAKRAREAISEGGVVLDQDTIDTAHEKLHNFQINRVHHHKNHEKRDAEAETKIKAAVSKMRKDRGPLKSPQDKSSVTEAIRRKIQENALAPQDFMATT